MLLVSTMSILLLLVKLTNIAAVGERISGHSLRTTTDGLVTDDSADSADSTVAQARVEALLIVAGLVRRAIRTH